MDSRKSSQTQRMSDQTEVKAQAVARRVAELDDSDWERRIAELCGDDNELSQRVRVLLAQTISPSTIDTNEHAPSTTVTPEPSLDANETLETPNYLSNAEQLAALLSSDFGDQNNELSASDRKALADACSEFEKQWQSNSPPEIADFVLDEFAEPIRHQLVRDLVCADIVHRERSGKSLSPGDYLKRMPGYRLAIESAWWSRFYQMRTQPDASDRARELATHVSNAASGMDGEDDGSRGRFQPYALHASGGLGAVFRARDQQIRRTVALKEIRSDRVDQPSARERFLFEAKVTGELEHPGIVPIYGLGKHRDGRPYYAMRFVVGETLSRSIREFHDQHPQPGSDAFYSQAFRALIRRFVDVCNAIHYAHDQGVLHRDIKPDNVMLGQYGETLVVDWGLAKRYALDDADGTETSEADESLPLLAECDDVSGDSVKGTLVFMSPEQAAGKNQQLTEATDIYSLGAMLFNLLTNQYSVGGESSREKLDRVKRGEVRDVVDLVSTAPRPLVSICRKAMAFEPADRYKSASELADDLERWAGDELVVAHADVESIADRSARLFRRYRSWTLAGVSSALVITVVSIAAALLIGSAWRGESLAKADALKSKGEALVFLESAEESINDWLVHSSDSLTYLPGGVSVRQRLLEMAAEDYRELAHLSSHDPEIAIHRGRIMLRLGDIARRARDTAQARVEYAAALEVFRASDTDEYLAEQANTHLRLGKCDVIDNDLAAARAEYKVAVEILDSLASLNRSARHLRYLAAARINLGAVLTELGELELALNELGIANELFEKIESLAGELDREEQSQQAIALEYLGRIHEQRGEFDRAASDLMLAASQLDALVASVPDYPPFLERRADVRVSIARLRSEFGDHKQALQHCELVVGDYGALLRSMPDDAFYREKLGLALTNLAITQHHGDQPHVALETLSQVEPVYEQVLDEYGLTVEALTFLDAKGSVLVDQEKSDEAVALYRRIETQYEMVVDETMPKKELRERFAIALSHHGLAQQQLGDIESSTTKFRQSLQLLTDLIAEQDLPRYRELIASVYERLAYAQFEDDPTVARDAFSKALEQRESIRPEYQSPRHLRDFALMIAVCPFKEIREANLTRAHKHSAAANTRLPADHQTASVYAILTSHQNPQAALTLIDEIESQFQSRTARDHFAAAVAHHALGNIERANDAFKEAEDWMSELRPGDHQLRALRAHVKRKLRETRPQ